MNRKTKALTLALPFIALLAAVTAFRHFNLYINMTESLPLGIYTLKTSEKILRGDVVLVVDLDEIGVDRKLCRQSRMLKEAAGLQGDMVSSDGESIFINGRQLPDSDIFEFDKLGRKLPHPKYPYTIQADEIYVTSQHKYGYDSRYYGPVPRTHVIGVAVPIFLFKGESR